MSEFSRSLVLQWLKTIAALTENTEALRANICQCALEMTAAPDASAEIFLLQSRILRKCIRETPAIIHDLCPNVIRVIFFNI
jgi:hypothetical protein